MNWIYTHHLSPFIVSARWNGQTVGLRWYGFAYVLSFALAYLTLRRAAVNGRIHNLDQRKLDALIMALVAGVVLGGRIGYVLQNLSVWRENIWFPFEIWNGGMAFFGGLAGVLLAVVWGVWKFRLRFWQVTDALTFPSALGLGIGRIANFVNGELVGGPTNGKWGVIFPQVDGLPRHPSQLYEAVSHLLLWGLLLYLARSHVAWREARAGRLSAVFLAFYGFARFATDFFRADETYFGPFSSGQWASLFIGVCGLMLLWRFTKQTAPRPIQD